MAFTYVVHRDRHMFVRRESVTVIVSTLRVGVDVTEIEL